MLEKLYQALIERDLYSKSYAEFEVQFENDEYKQRVYDAIVERDLYSKSFEDFNNQYSLKKKDTPKVEEPKVEQPQVEVPSVSTEAPSSTDSSGERAYLSEDLGDVGSFIESMPLIGDFVGDIYRAGKSGYYQGQASSEALDLLAGNKSEKEIKEYIEAVKKQESFAPSDEMRELVRLKEKHGSLLGTIMGIGKNPGVLSEVMTQSIAAMANKEVIGAGAVGAAAGTAIAPGIGTMAGGILASSTVLESGSVFTELLREKIEEKNLEFDVDGIRSVLEDEEALSDIRVRGIGRGLAIGTIEAFTGGIAGKVGAKVALKAATKTRGAVKGLATATGIEAVGGSTGEFVGMTVAGQEYDAGEILMEGVAGAPGSILQVPSIIAGANKVTSYKVNNKLADRQSILDFVEKATPQELMDSKIEVTNDEAISDIVDEKMTKAKIVGDIDPRVTDQADIDAIVDLEYQVQKLKNKETVSAKNAVQKLNQQILDIQNKYDVDVTEEAQVEEDAVVEEEVAQEETATEETTTEEEVVEQRYEAPKDSRGIAAVYKVYDNRKGQQYSHDGDENWIVVNEETNRVMSFKTKKDATSESKSPDHYAYGEGEIIGQEVEVTPIERPASVERVNREVDNIIKKTEARKGKSVNPKVVLDNVLSYVQQNSKLYQELTDSERESMVLELTKRLDIPVERSPEVRTVLGLPKTQKETITVDPYKELKSRLRELEKVSQEAVAAEKTEGRSRLEVLQEKAKSIMKGAKLSSFQTRMISKRVAQAVLDGRNMDAAMQYVDKVTSTVNMREKINTYEKLRKKLKKKSRSKFGVAPNLVPFLDRIANTKVDNLDLDMIDDAIKVMKVATSGRVINIPAVREMIPTMQRILDADVFVSEPTQEFVGRENLEYKSRFDAITKEELAAMSEDLSKTYEAEKANVDAGEMTNNAIKLIEAAEAAREAANVQRATKGFKPARILAFQNYIKSLLKKNTNVTLERIRSNSTRYIDDILGNTGGYEIYNATFGKLSKAYSKLQADVDVYLEKMAQAREALAGKGLEGRTANQVRTSSFKMKLYEIQKEFESNPEYQNKKVYTALQVLDETIKYYKSQNIEDSQVAHLEKIREEFLEGGNLDSETLFNKLSDQEKKAHGLIKEAEKGLTQKMLYVSATLRGGRATAFNDYTHHSVLMSPDERSKLVDEKFKIITGTQKKASTKAGVIEERTSGVKPLNLDIFSSSQSSARQVLTDYHMTSPMRTVYSTLSNLVGNTNLTAEQREAAVSLQRSVDESTRIIFERDYNENQTISERVLEKAATIGYRAALSSVPRAFSEFGSNILYSLFTSPESLAIGMEAHSNLGQNATAILGKVFANVGSVHTARVFSKDTQASAFAGKTNFTRYDSSPSGYTNEVYDKAEYILGTIPKQWTRFVGKLSDFIIESPDRTITKPIWTGKFISSFKKYSEGVDVDLQKIADNDVEYMNQYREAIDKARFDADETVAKGVTSLNPFDLIIKNANKKGDTNLMSIYKMANSFMARFTVNEYAQARQAIQSLIYQDTKLTEAQAAGTLMGITARMTSYMLMYSYLRELMVEAFSDEDEEFDKEKYKDLAARQLVGSGVTLLTRGTSGNIPMVAINMMTEMINKEYLESLRSNEEYNPYEHSIVFSQLSPEEIQRKGLAGSLATIFGGPYQYFLKAGESALTSGIGATSSKKQSTRDKYKEKLMNVHALDALGLMNAIPFYKDIRTLAIEGFLKKYPPKNLKKPSNSGGGSKKFGPKRFDSKNDNKSKKNTGPFKKKRF